MALGKCMSKTQEGSIWVYQQPETNRKPTISELGIILRAGIGTGLAHVAVCFPDSHHSHTCSMGRLSAYAWLAYYTAKQHHLVICDSDGAPGVLHRMYFSLISPSPQLHPYNLLQLMAGRNLTR